MKCHNFLVLAASIAVVSALSVDTNYQKVVIEDKQRITQGQCLIELSPGETRWVTEDDKWDLKRVRYHQALECIQ